MQLLSNRLAVFQAIRPYSGRNLIGRRTESDRAADGIRSGGGRNPIRRGTFKGCFQGVLSGGALVSSAPTEQY